MEKSNYEIIADEYYDESHITSRNFDIATLCFCASRAFPLPSEGLVLEVGAGKGNANNYFQINPDRIIQTDISHSMLSLQPREKSLLALTCNALDMPFMADSFSIVIAMLYDPYNKPQLYYEVNRVLKKGGIFLGSLPHISWGSTLRKSLGLKQNVALFRKYRSEINNLTIELNSFLMDDSMLTKVINESGLKVMNFFDLNLPNYVKNISPDITKPAKSLKISPYKLPVIKFIVARKL